MSCCHYDEGYEDGLAAGGGEEGAVVDVLDALSREYERAGDWQAAAYAREFATKLGNRSVKRMVEDVQKLDTEVRTLYEKSRAA